MILKIQNRISATGNPTARGFNFFAHPLCAFEGALGLSSNQQPTHKTAHLQTAQATPRPKFAKELFSCRRTRCKLYI